jgi:hypothetical protein
MIDNGVTQPLEEAVLEFDHNVIEHLGIRLYQNKVMNVVAELVANCWDADAKRFYVDTSTDQQSPFIAVYDDGCGMSYDDIRNRYLVIGKKKRNSPKDKSPGGRAPMGRKGIGKLAPFGIARQVDVLTIKDSALNWFTLQLDDLLKSGPGQQRYRPIFTRTNAPLGDDWSVPATETAAVLRAFLEEKSEKGDSGTLILMSDLSTNRIIPADEIVQGLVDKFTVILARQDFVGTVNGKPIDASAALPSFEFRVPDPSQPYATEYIGGKEVRHWAGFVGSAAWPSDQAGVGVYVHGKIGQDRPFFFGAKGKEIFQRYLYAVVEADWLDELDTDLISTDRTSINWADPDAANLREWGAKKVGVWLDAYSRHRASRHLIEIKQAAKERRAKKIIPTFSNAENDAIDKLVSDATEGLGKGEEAEATRDDLLGAVSKAWINLPSRSLVTDLWSQLSAKSGTSAFGAVVDKLQEHSVPEAMGLALTFAQRAYALSVLTDLVHKKSETNLQKLIEDFPWILQPRGDLLTADQQLKTTMERAAEALQDRDPSRAGRVSQGMSEVERADFVFLTDASQRHITIAEIKAPGVELNQSHRRQLSDYLDFTAQYHSSAKLEGLLIGTMPSPPIDAHDTRIMAKGWDSLLIECRSAYIQLLASMLERADPDPADARIQLVEQFGGDAVWQLLEKLGAKSERLAALMTKHKPLISQL